MRKSFNHGAARRETDPAGVSVKVLRRNLGKNHGRAHLYLVVGGPARPFKDTTARDIRPVTTQIGDEQEVTVWALMLVLGLSILMAGYILCAKTSGFACRMSPTNVTTTQTMHRFADLPAWLAEDMTVYRGDNQDPAFIEKIRKLISQRQDWPRHILNDDGYFKVI